MSTLLIGHWDYDGRTLTITESHEVEDGDQATMDALTGPAFVQGAGWACEFDVDRHCDAVQRAYEEYAHDDGSAIEDDVEHVEPVTY
ncbi:hypothetical protein [Streptomyces niveus]|uniref:hypothetical protein n=1 Tax=Streptomyces niveus TaxID=193462 RepID=UPI00344A41A3